MVIRAASQARENAERRLKEVHTTLRLFKDRRIDDLQSMQRMHEMCLMSNAEMESRKTQPAHSILEAVVATACGVFTKSKKAEDGEVDRSLLNHASVEALARAMLRKPHASHMHFVPPPTTPFPFSEAPLVTLYRRTSSAYRPSVSSLESLQDKQTESQLRRIFTTIEMSTRAERLSMSLHKYSENLGIHAATIFKFIQEAKLTPPGFPRARIDMMIAKYAAAGLASKCSGTPLRSRHVSFSSFRGLIEELVGHLEQAGVVRRREEPLRTFLSEPTMYPPLRTFMKTFSRPRISSGPRSPKPSATPSSALRALLREKRALTLIFENYATHAAPSTPTKQGCKCAHLDFPSLFRMMKEFDVVPGVIQKVELQVVFSHFSFDSRPGGPALKVLAFDSWMDVLSDIASRGFDAQPSGAARALCLLRVMDLSHGRQKLKKRSRSGIVVPPFRSLMMK